MPWHHLHHALQMRLYAWDHLQFPFFSTFLLSHHLDKGSSLSHQSINTVPKLFWLTVVLFCKLQSWLSIFGAGQRFASFCIASVILYQSLLRTVDCQSITPAFWKLLLILKTRILGCILTAFMICLSSSPVVFSLVVSKLLISPCPLFLL